MQPPLTLFLDAFFASPWDYRCWVALREKGVDFSASRVMVAEGSTLTQVYRDGSITARVPGLLHGDFWLAESSAIIEYLEEAFPPPAYPSLWPQDLRRRARARQVVSFMGADLSRMVDERPSWTVAYPSKRPALTKAARAEADELLRMTARLLADAVLEPWSIACADLTFGLLRLARSGETLPPAIQAFVDANVARSSVRSYLEHDRPPYPPATGRRART